MIINDKRKFWIFLNFIRSYTNDKNKNRCFFDSLKFSHFFYYLPFTSTKCKTHKHLPHLNLSIKLKIYSENNNDINFFYNNKNNLYQFGFIITKYGNVYLSQYSSTSNQRGASNFERKDINIITHFWYGS